MYGRVFVCGKGKKGKSFYRRNHTDFRESHGYGSKLAQQCKKLPKLLNL